MRTFTPGQMVVRRVATFGMDGAIDGLAAGALAATGQPGRGRYAGLLPGSYLATVGARPVGVRLPAGLVYAYAVVLALWAVGRFSSEAGTVERSVDPCLQGLHRQFLAARRHYLEWAGQLYARAYEPVRSGSPMALGEQARPLQAAEVIQRRAEAIQQWPFQQRRLGQIAAIVGTVVTFVITGIITRLIVVRLEL